MRSFLALLMMVSSSTAVLPVWRSPMMSSRWPRPMGIIESMAFSPVAMGSRTGWRSIMPGARRSTGSVSVVAIGPLSSMGAPSVLTTRPTMAGPTGTLRILPVRLTSSPSLNSVYSPRITAPTESSSRLRASPAMPCGKLSSSPAITLSSPCRRAMPSPREVMVPTSSTCTFES